MEQEYSECRTCGVRAPKENMESIFSSQDVALKFKTLLSLNLVMDRRLPEFLCKPCVMELNMTHDFIKKALSMQKKHLDQIFQAKEKSKETTADPLPEVTKEVTSAPCTSGAAEGEIAKEQPPLAKILTLVKDAFNAPEVINIDDEQSNSPPRVAEKPVQQPPAPPKPQLKLKPISSLMKLDIPTQQVQPTVQTDAIIKPDIPIVHFCDVCKQTYRGTMKQYMLHKTKCLPKVVPIPPQPDNRRKYILINNLPKNNTVAQVPPNINISQPIQIMPNNTVTNSNPITTSGPNIANVNTYRMIPGQSTIHPGNLVNTIRISTGMSTSSASPGNTLLSGGNIGILPAPSQSTLNSIQISSGETSLASGNINLSALLSTAPLGSTGNILTSGSTLMTPPSSSSTLQTTQVSQGCIMTTTPTATTHTQLSNTRPIRPACVMPFPRQQLLRGTNLRATRFAPPQVLAANQAPQVLAAKQAPQPESSSSGTQPVSVIQRVSQTSGEVLPVVTSTFSIAQEPSSQNPDNSQVVINETPNVVALMSLWSNPDLNHCSLFEEEWRTASLMRDTLDGICECSICRIFFLSEMEYRQHFIYEQNLKVWMHRFWFCTACKLNFSSQRLLDEHFKIGLHGNLREQYTCSLCPLFSSKRENVLRHLLKIHSYCPHCHTNLQKARVKSLKDKNSSLDPRACISCGLLINRSSEIALKKCFEVPENERVSICNICSVSFSNVDGLTTHFFINHSDLMKDGMFEGPNIQNVRPYEGKEPPFIEEGSVGALDNQEDKSTNKSSPGTTSSAMEVQLSKEEVLDVEEMETESVQLIPQSDGAISLYCCTYCLESYPIFLDLMMHINSAHFVPFYTCEKCGRNFRNMVESLTHDCTIEDNVKLQLVRIEDLLE